MTLDRHTCRLFHFDRDGVKHTPPIDFHENAETFIRLVLGITSLDEEILGLDTAVQWETDSKGRKSSGIITVATDSSDWRQDKVYTLCKPQPDVRAFTIIGRGTVRWRALATGISLEAPPTEVIVKFSWRPEDQVGEDVFLSTTAVGIRGIAQMITKRDKEWCTGDMRNGGEDAARSCLGSCIVLEAHGDSISYFTSQRQFLGAIRDVICSACISRFTWIFTPSNTEI